MVDVEAEFCQLFGQWLNDDRADASLEARLLQAIRPAWIKGDRDERYCVIDLVRLTTYVAGFDLIVEGIESDDAGLAAHAAANALYLLSDGYRFPPRARSAFERYGERFPDWAIFRDVALRRLDAIDSRSKDG